MVIGVFDFVIYCMKVSFDILNSIHKKLSENS